MATATANTASFVCRPDLILKPSSNGRFIAKDPRTGQFFSLGEQEVFLLECVGRKSEAETLAAYEARFSEPLSSEDLADFIQLAQQRGLLIDRSAETLVNTPAVPQTTAAVPKPSPKPRQSLLFWRKTIFDPDRLFSWLLPKLWFFWTPAFLLLSATSIVAAATLLWGNWHDFTTFFSSAWRWQTIAYVWLTLIVVTACHEFAHGLTCKRYGGEVHEVGFLLLYFMPGFFCNVSDAWLFPEKSKRLWVTFAGGYFELFLWSLAVFVWRLTTLDSLPNYLAWVVISVAGTRVFFNFNPLLKLDDITCWPTRWRCRICSNARRGTPWGICIGYCGERHDHMQRSEAHSC